MYEFKIELQTELKTNILDFNVQTMVMEGCKINLVEENCLILMGP